MKTLSITVARAGTQAEVFRCAASVLVTIVHTVTRPRFRQRNAPVNRSGDTSETRMVSQCSKPFFILACGCSRDGHVMIHIAMRPLGPAGKLTACRPAEAHRHLEGPHNRELSEMAAPGKIA